MHIIITLLLGGGIGAIAGLITHKHIPGGIIGNVLVGFVGSILGRVLLGPFGPAWKEFFFLPALLGAVICVLIITLLHFMINKFY
ncbi:TPA: GlsB/YeaQ/YmgE family stress response membrane protein [Bacillus toyonensis]|uniref:GlsB/YeaQ/YmgE family stress response membrane protein n=1 Tax=Bacillus sp. 2SH TaxID=2502202 RepID=UPI0010F63D85|nr:GlsB/YeaQ/YmgE family stress response membrane protein [Bacillus sp. 2SH]HDR7951679.1 GlsB/YeaQ/YmgE family stress response membrane protein [Bacillus toyonensis]